jgi:hypothetical protein
MDNVPPALSPSRPDFNKYIYRQVKELVRYMQSPDMFNLNHLFHLLRYLKSCPDLGPRYLANPKDFPNGVQLYASADSAFANLWNKQSTGAYTLSIGKNNAPFKEESSNVAPGIYTKPSEAEY